MPAVEFTETILRDANQSLIATRLPFHKFEPALYNLDDAGFYSLECWGGATFDSCLRFLNENPWERLKKIKSACKKTKLQMLLRGQNLLGYRHYPDDVVRNFISRSVANGIDVIRIFDALNDIRNLKVAIDETLKNKAEAQAALAYSTSPVHSVESYGALARELEDMGASSLCVKDMAGVLNPKDAYDLVKYIKEHCGLRLSVHTHCTTGMGYMTYLKAVEAGADVIDTAISSFSGGTSQPATETLAYLFEYMGYETGLDGSTLKRINDRFKPLRDEYANNGTLSHVVTGTDAECLIYQIPGGMLSNLVSQLSSQNALDRLDEVLAETPLVRAEMGYPPLVTPLSQMVGTQAVNNVLGGQRYKNVLKEIKAYVRGEYGKPPGDIDPEVKKMVLGGEEAFTGRFADTLPPGMEAGKKAAGELAADLDDVLSYILFTQVAEIFFRGRAQQKKADVKYAKDENPTRPAADTPLKKVKYKIEVL